MTENRSSNTANSMLAILGSPHADGPTAAMLDCAVQSAREAGWEVIVVPLYQRRCELCRGCRKCLTTGRCVIRDDMDEIRDLLCSSRRVVLAAPTYWACVPAAVKNLFDRLLGTAMVETKTFPKPRDLAGKEYLLLTACHTPFPFSWLCGQSRGAFRTMNEFFRTAGMKRIGQVAFSGATGKNRLPEAVSTRIKRLVR